MQQHRGLAGVIDAAGPDFHRDDPAVLRATSPLDLLKPAFHERFEIARRLLSTFGWNQVKDVPADQIFPHCAV